MTRARILSVNASAYDVTAAELAASITPTSFQYLPGDIRRYGADPTGALDSTAAIQSAISAHAGDAVFIPAGTFKISSPLTVTANTLIYGAGMGTAIVSATNAGVNQFVVTGNQCTFRDFTITVVPVGVTSQVAAININAANYCLVQNMEISGVSWAGVGIFNGASYNIVDGCYFHGFQGSVNDSADIVLSYDSGNCAYNVIRNNRCYGGNYHGIMMLANDHCDFNIVEGNRIGQHLAYGIVDYAAVTNTDRFNQIVNNYIENIQGSVISNQSGAGIYIVSSGGELVQGNTINNCCVQTTSYGLAPAGIGINGISAQAPVNVIGNVIEGMTKFDGILVVGSSSGANITGNRIRMPANTTGNGGIYINTSSHVLVDSNHITVTPTTGTTVASIAINIGSALSGVTLSNNICIGGNSAQINVQGANTLTQLVVAGNSLFGGGASATGMLLSGIATGAITGNNISTTTAVGLFISGATQMRVANNYITSTGSTTVQTAGTCTGSYFDESNGVNGTPGSFNNGGTGCVIAFLATASPGSGTFVVGDTAINSAPSAASQDRWRCTTGGSPGTWTALTLP